MMFPSNIKKIIKLEHSALCRHFELTTELRLESRFCRFIEDHKETETDLSHEIMKEHIF